MEGEDFDELVSSIGDNGLREPIVLFEKLILDGRNRYRACQKVKVEPRYTAFEGDDPKAWSPAASNTNSFRAD
jgi:ParB-like chromosome segregation protein Spo0J